MVIVNEAGNWIGKILGAPVGSLLAGSDEFEFLLSDTGEITVTNAGNGQNSENTGVVNYETNNTTVQMNQANLINNLDLSANTGGNSASRNTAGDSNVTTGDAEIIANLVNFVNNNIVGGRLFVNVVNVFGSWIGDFVGPGFDKEEDSSLAQASSNDIGGANYTGGNSQSNTSQTSTKTINSTNDSTQDSVGDNNIISNISFSGFGLAGGSILGRNESDDETETSVGTYIPQISGKRVVNINLAYVLIFVLPFAVSLLRKRFGKVLLRN